LYLKGLFQLKFNVGWLILNSCRQRDPLLERARRVGVRVHPRPFAPWKPLEKPRSSETRALSSAPGPASSHSENEQNDVMMDSEGPTFGDEFEPDILRSCVVASASTHVC
jgi:hypothetical protein